LYPDLRTTTQAWEEVTYKNIKKRKIILWHGTVARLGGSSREKMTPSKKIISFALILETFR
jgi:hypothetical protein